MFHSSRNSIRVWGIWPIGQFLFKTIYCEARVLSWWNETISNSNREAGKLYDFSETACNVNGRVVLSKLCMT